MKIAKISHLNSLNIKVTEKILDKNLKSFCENSLLINNISPKKHSLFFSTYLEETSSYQLIFCSRDFSTTFLNLLEKENFIKDSNLENILLINHTFFSIFKNQKLYYFQKLENFIEQDDLINYIQTKLFIKIDHSIPLIDEDLERIYAKNISSNKNFYSFLFYMIYLFLLLFSLFLALNKNDLSKEPKRTAINYPTFKPINSELSNILEKINAKNLQIKEFDLENNSSKLIVLSKEKKEIYDFLNEYKPYVISNNTNFIEGEKLYESLINLKRFK